MSSLWNQTASETGSIGRLVTTITDDQDILNYIITMDGSYEPFLKLYGLRWSVSSCVSYFHAAASAQGGNAEYAESMAMRLAFQLASQKLHGTILFCSYNKNIIDFLNGYVDGVCCWQTKFNLCFM